MADSTIYSKIKTVMDKYEIPEYIWVPIAQTESNFDPEATNDNGTELSKGIFQINLLAHPQFADYDVTDPTINAEIAAQNMIAPAYAYAQSVTDDKLKQAEIVYTGLTDPENVNSDNFLKVKYGGIRPDWSSALKAKFEKNYYSYLDSTTNEYTKVSDTETGQSSQYTSSYDSGITSGNVSGGSENLLTFGQLSFKFVIIIVVVLVIIFAVFQLFKTTKAGNVIIQNGKKLSKLPLSAELEGASE